MAEGRRPRRVRLDYVIGAGLIVALIVIGLIWHYSGRESTDDAQIDGHITPVAARVGGTIPTLRVGVVDAQGKETRWLPIPMPAEGFYLGKVDWARNPQSLMIEKLSRFRNERELLLADIHTGALRRVFHETNAAWVDGSYELNAGWMWIRDYQAFIVLSEKDGWRHAYVYSRDGKELALLTPGKFDIIERAVVDEKGGWFYFYASPDNATVTC